jgi:hypothetical protein
LCSSGRGSSLRSVGSLTRGLFGTSARSGGFGLRCSFATSGFGADLSGLAIGRFLSSARFFLRLLIQIEAAATAAEQHDADDAEDETNGRTLLLLRCDFCELSLVLERASLLLRLRSLLGLEANPKLGLFFLAALALFFRDTALLFSALRLFRRTNARFFFLLQPQGLRFFARSLFFFFATAIILLLLQALLLDVHELLEREKDAVLFLIGHPNPPLTL